MNDTLHAILVLVVLLAAGPAGPGCAAAQTESGETSVDAPTGSTVPTKVTVRAVANDAKVIGSNVGGARIRIEAVRSGRILAEGRQEGDTGDTRRIMETPRERGATVYGTGGAAAFRTALDLTRPVLVDVSATGPLDSNPPLYRASRRMLLVPGRDVTGEGIVLQLNGFTVELIAPEDELVRAGDPVEVRSRVTMLCGCGTEPGGMWDSDRYTIEARLLEDGRTVSRTDLSFAGTMSTYRGRIEPPEPGRYTLQVLATDAERSNFGRAETSLVVAN